MAHEAAYTGARVRVIARHAGNPFGAFVREDAGQFACRVAGVPSPWLNRAFGLRDPVGLATWFTAAWRAETWADQTHADALLAIGKRPAAGDAVVTGRPQPRTATSIEDGSIEIFLDTHLAGLGIPDAVRPMAKDNMRGWEGLPGWHFLLARRDGRPAGTCVLFVADGLAYVADMATHPDFRLRGVQTELLAECHIRAAGLEMLWARCRFGSQSHRNLGRAGLATFCTTVFWV